MIQALKTKQIDGMFLDHYAASYYQARDKLKSLITVKMFEFQRDVGVLFSKDKIDLADCLNFYRTSIWRMVQAISSTYKVSFMKDPSNTENNKTTTENSYSVSQV